MGKAATLLERAHEIERLHAALDDAAEGRGRLMVVEGPAGIGKTALLGFTCAAAHDSLVVLRARGGELEREFPHGVVRQLFESHLKAADTSRREQLLAGAARLAAPAVSPDSVVPEQRASADPSFAVTHGLYWLTVNLADERPVLLAVDDVQWSDAGSLRYLVHLTRRLEGLPVVVAIGLRTGEPEAPEALIGDLVGDPAAEILRPQALTRTAVGEMLQAATGEPASAEFVAACLTATGGIPFLLRELIAALVNQRVKPTTEAVALVGDIGPRTVGRVILRRLSRLPAAASELTRAVAVLGVDAGLHTAGRLARLGESDAVAVTDILVRMDILEPGRPLRFVHPFVRAAVYESMSVTARAAAHGRAADLLADQGADVDAVATHLLQAEPRASADRVARLREAAARAIARGAAESAVTYLARALEEGGLATDQRAQLHHEVGRAFRVIDRDQAIPHLTTARDIAVDPALRAEIAYDLADIHYYTGRWEEASQLAEDALAELGGRDPEFARRIEALRSGQAFWDKRHLGEFVHKLPELRELAEVDSPAGRLIAVMLAAASAWLTAPKEEVLRFVDLGWAGGRFLAEGGAESWVLPNLFQALVLVEELDRATTLIDLAVEDARALGSEWGATMALPHRAWVQARRGDLRAAAAEAPAASEAWAVESGLWPVAHWYCVDPLIERPELADDARRVQTREIDPALRNLVAWSIAHECRGRIRLANGDRAGAIEDLTRCSQEPHAYGNPNGWGWRPALALAIAPAEPDRALELATAELDSAQRVGMPRAIGVALRTLADIDHDVRAIEHYEESVSVLEESPAPLELARSLVGLGSAHRRAGRRTEAREPLRAGLDLANRCGAARLEERARTELAATGARPRRARIAGRDALTPSEHRIAQMAADGLSNREIAQALFVTRKNVENHLGRVYSKLDIRSREELDSALRRDEER